MLGYSSGILNTQVNIGKSCKFIKILYCWTFFQVMVPISNILSQYSSTGIRVPSRNIQSKLTPISSSFKPKTLQANEATIKVSLLIP